MQKAFKIDLNICIPNTLINGKEWRFKGEVQ